MTASACSSAAKSGTSVGPQAASDGLRRAGPRSWGNRRTMCPPVPRTPPAASARQPVRPVSTMRSRRPRPIARAGQVECDAPVAERKQPVHHAAGDGPPATAPSGPKGRAYSTWSISVALALVDRLDRCVCSQRLNGPATCTSVNCSALDEVAMQGFPARLERAAAQFERHAAAVGDAAMARDDAQVLPGRCQALESAGPGVPGKQGRGRSVDDRCFS